MEDKQLLIFKDPGELGKEPTFVLISAEKQKSVQKRNLPSDISW